MSDIRNWGQFIRGRWDWTKFGYEKGFPRNCQFTDIDASVEFNGRGLFVECKAYDGEGYLPGIDVGQSRYLDWLVSEHPASTVFILFGCGACNDPYAVRNVTTGEFHDWRGMEKTVRRKALKAFIDQAMGLRDGYSAGAA